MLGWNLPSVQNLLKCPIRQEIALLDPFDVSRLLCLYLSIGK